MGLKCTEKAIFFYQKGRFSLRLCPKMYNILNWRVHICRFFCDDPFRIFFFSFSFHFSRPFYPRYLLLFTSFLIAVKKLCVNYGQSLEMGLWSIIGVMGLFIAIFAQKTDHVSFYLLLRKAVDIQNGQLDWSVLALLCAYQEYLVASKVVQRAWPNIYAYMRV